MRYILKGAYGINQKLTTMKKRFLLLATLFLMVSLVTNAQEYWIEGFYERHGAGNYTLKDVITNGVKIDGHTRLTQTLHGNKMRIKCDGVDASMVQFAFENADLKCDNPDITFQYWSDDINDWKTDVEACKYEAAGYSQKDMVMMLVLDYSSSMSTNRGRMQDMAYTFIKNAANYSNGNIHIGIVAFSGMDITKVMEIIPLRRENLSKFERFIKTEAQPGMETALYYAFDVAMKEIEKYVAMNNFDKDNYNGSCMITFTDGLDNASINDQISNRMQRGSKNEYLGYLSDKVQKGPQQKRVLGLPVESYAVGFTGSEHFTTDDLTLFRLVLQKLTTDDNHFTLSDDFSVVESFFNTIFEQLTNRWKVLNLYIGEAQYGKVRWMLNCPTYVYKPDPKPEPPRVYSEKPYKFSIGVIAIKINGLSMKYFTGKRWAMQTDIGYSPVTYTESIRIDGHFEYQYDPYWDEYYEVWVPSGFSSNKVSGSAIMLHQTFMWEPRFVDSPGLQLHGMLGAGVGVGLWGGDFDIAPQGIAGLEFILGIPLTLQLDVRPMMPMLRDGGELNLGFNISARYYFK